MKVLILGSNGMLGHMVFKYLNEKTNAECTLTDLKWPSRSFRRSVQHFKGDYIINCIGKIPQKTIKGDCYIRNQYIVNYLLPIWLDQNVKCKIIHPGTDCEMDKDEYGISKKKASNWIKQESTNTKIIKTSIIGPELNSNYSLMEWFLSQKKEVFGFSNFYWNGVTTLTWAEYCLDLMENWDSYPVETILEGERISKFNLLRTIAKVYNKNTVIKKVDKPVKDKCLKGMIKTKSIKDQLKIMKEFLE